MEKSKLSSANGKVKAKVKLNIFNIYQVNSKLLKNCPYGTLKLMKMQETLFGSTDFRQKYKSSSSNGVRAKLPKLNIGSKRTVAF